MMTMNESIEDIAVRRKRAIYRSWHRGTREMDLILGRFAERFLPGCSESDVALYEALLEESDPDLYNWITGVERPPERVVNRIFGLLKNNVNS